MSSSGSNDSLNIKDIFLESWERVDGIKWTVFKLYFLYPFIFSLVSLIIFILLNILGGLWLVITFIFLQFLVILFWQISAIAVGLRQATDQETSSEAAILDCTKVLIPLLIVIILYYCVTFIYYFIAGLVSMLILSYLSLTHSLLGKLIEYFILLLIPSILLVQIFFFAIPLIITQQVSVQFSLISSFLMLKKHFLIVIPCAFLMLLLAIISSLPWGIGLIWTIPMYVNMIGIIYRDAYGWKPDNVNNTPSSGPTTSSLPRGVNRGAFIHNKNHPSS